MTIRDIAVAFGIEVDQKSVSAAENAIKGVKNMASKLLGAIGIGFSIAGIANLAEAAADVEALKSQFSQVFGDMEQDAADKLNKIADDTGVLANRMKGSFTQIAAFSKTTGMEEAEALDIANRSMIAVADSAAFYDRSIENVTESLQSFLKGNFENDAALGLSCTETTRNTAANALYGKSFKDLSEAEKQLTLLQMVEDANKASGALGQAARESDTWTNQLGNLKQNVQDLKAAAGNAFLKPAVMVLKLLNSLVSKATVGMKKLTSETGILTKAFNSMHALVKRLKPAIDRMMQTLQIGAKKGMGMVKNVIDKLGGVDNALKLLAIIAGAFFIVMNWSKIISGTKAFITLLTKMKGLFSLANLKTLAIVAAVVLLALIVEDFINFLMGNDSVIGTIFDKAGIGADNAREAIFKAWQKVKEFLSNLWTWIKTTAVTVFTTLKDVISKHMGSISSSIEKIWNGIKTILSVVWENISGLAKIVFGGLLSFFGGWHLDLEGVFDAIVSAVDAVLGVFGDIGDWISNHKAVMDSLVVVLGSIAAAFGIVQAAIAAYNIISGICTAVSTIMAGGFSIASAAGGVLAGVIGFITSPVTIAIAAIAALIAIGVLLYKNWDTVKEFAVNIWNGIKDFLQSVMEAISSFFTSIWEGISSFFQGIWNGIVSFVTAYINAVMTVISTVLGAISSVWSSIWEGISNFFQGIWNGIVSFLTGIWNTITSTISNAINSAYSTIVSVLQSIYNFFSSIFSNIATSVSSTFNNIVSGIKGAVGNIKTAIVDGFNAAISFITSLPSKAIQWGADFIGGLKNGITSGVQGIVNAVKGIGDKIKSFLHFSVPDEGPLTDYESWMPDFMGGLAEGISSKEDTVLDKVKGLAGGISTLMKGATASAATATGSAVNNTSNTTNVTQNNTFNNSYSGNDVQAQQNVSKGMKQSAQDATSYMAKGLAYAR